MTDGPFRNLKLGSGWKRLADAAQNDASSTTECGLLATDGLVRHLATKENSAAVQELEAYTQQPQLDFDPRATIEEIFDAYEKTPFLDTLKKELLYRIADGTPPAEALDRALDAAVKEEVGEARNRFEEECILQLGSDRRFHGNSLKREFRDSVPERIAAVRDLHLADQPTHAVTDHDQMI